jgi:hypothetical protein
MNLKQMVGLGLLIAGSAVMLAYLGVLGFQVKTFLNSSPMDLLGCAAGLGLASLHFAQSVAFSPGLVFSFAYKILVLFSALAVILAGLALLHNRTPKMNSGHQPHTSEPVKGDQ